MPGPRTRPERRLLAALLLAAVVLGGARGVSAGTNHWTSGGPAGRQATAVAVDPTVPGTLFAGTDDGVFASIDAGASWEPTGLNGASQRIDALLALPGSPTVLFASGDFAVRKSADGGHTWQAADEGFGARYVQALAADPDDPRTLYAGTTRPSGTLPSGVFKTTDGGRRWMATAIANSPVVSAVAVDPSDTRVVYAVDHFDVTRSDDGGATWSAIAPFRFRTAGPLIAVGSAAQSAVYVAVEGTIYRSTDRGRTWTGGNGGLAGAVTSLAADPAVHTTVYAGTDRGVFKSTDGGAHWASLMFPRPGERIDDLAVDAHDRRTLHAATAVGVFSLTQDAFFACDGDCDGDDRVAVDELVRGVRIAIGIAPLAACPSLDGNHGGDVSIDELVGAVAAALDGCLPAARVLDLAGFTRFELQRRRGYGFCPPLGLYAATITREASGRYALASDVLEEGVAGVDDCLPGVVGEVACAVVRPRPTRLLAAPEVDRLLTAFAAVLVHDQPDRICRDVIFDPCLINVLAWDDRQLVDFVCGAPRIDAVDRARIEALLDALARMAADATAASPAAPR